MPQSKRGSEISKLVFDWLDSFGDLSHAGRESLLLIWFEETDEEYQYHFAIMLKDFRRPSKKQNENRFL
jgi:hypothetical protein